jgi:hypothetical protein
MTTSERNFSCNGRRRRLEILLKKKRHKYTQFDYMLFLLPAIQASATYSNYAPMKDNKKLRIPEYSTLPTQKRETPPRKMQN